MKKINKEIIIDNPYTLDLSHYFDKQVEQFGSVKEFIKFMKKNFQMNKVPVYQTKKDFSGKHPGDLSIINYDTIEVGQQMLWKRPSKSGLSFSFDIVEIVHKFGYVLFIKSLTDDVETFINCGATSIYDEYGKGQLPQYSLYPMKVIKHSWITIEDFKLPKCVEIINVDKLINDDRTEMY